MDLRRHLPRRWAAAATLLSVAACAPEPPPERPRTPKVLVIGIDGVRPDVLAEVATPNIDALIADGAYTAHARTGYPTVSGPGWSSMLNGVWPDKHGVTGNDFENDDYETYPDFLSRAEMAKPELFTVAIADWIPLIASVDERHPLTGPIDERVALDGYEIGWAEADSASAEMAVLLLRTQDPDALFLYLGNPDETSHQYQSIGEEYRASIAEADRHVGRIMEALRARPTYDSEDWLVLSSTDHGRREDGGHGGDSEEELTIYYLASGPSASKGMLTDSTFVVDVAVTALAHLGIEIDEAWRLDGRVVGLAR